MAYFKDAYSYPDLHLWRDEAWDGWENLAAPLFRYLAKLYLAKLKVCPLRDRYKDRTDEITDEVNHAPYFKDIVEEWQKNGMYFSSYGMMGELMAPTSIEKHEIYDPKVLFIPFVRQGSPHEAMNLLAENDALLKECARENILVQFADCPNACGGALMEKAIETQGTFRISYKNVYLDISLLEEAGVKLCDVPGLDTGGWPDPIVLAGRKVVDISDKWQINIAHQYSISVLYRKNQPQWNYERHIRSLAGKRQAESMRLERDFSDFYDPRLMSFWKEKGIRCESHTLNRDWYVTLSPEALLKQPKTSLPLLVVMKEPRTACPGTMLTAFQFYYDFIELCARGEFIMLFFALETPWDNDDTLPDILNEVFKLYPVDQSRVYLTGQSHNGYYALEFYRTHPKLIACTATLCDPVGLKTGARIDYYMSRSQEIIESFRKYDYPLININGNLENSYNKPNRSKETQDEDVIYFQNRLKAFKLPMKTKEEILSCGMSTDYVTRKNGVPSDRTEVRYMMGSEVYLSDYKNEKGKWFFRYISLENTPHMIMPQMAELSWEFMRRFARNTKTGEIIERY